MATKPPFPLSSTISNETSERFKELLQQTLEADTEELRKLKAPFRIAFENLYEQILKDVANETPRNSHDARRIISKQLEKADDENPARRRILEALREALKAYEPVEKKEYVDTSKDVRLFVEVGLVNLLVTLINEGAITANDVLRKLCNDLKNLP